MLFAHSCYILARSEAAGPGESQMNNEKLSVLWVWINTELFSTGVPAIMMYW